MATYEQRGKKIRVKIEKHGVTKSKTFDNKTEARAWATAFEAEINAGRMGKIPDKTFGDLLEKYQERIDPIKRRGDYIRLTRIIRDDKISKVKLIDFNSTHVAEWRDRRLKVVSSASVNREWNTLSPACKVAIVEWRWLTHNPFSEVKRPQKPEARTRRVTETDLEKISFVAGNDFITATSRVYAAFQFAVETGMRAGEIVNLRWSDINIEERYLTVRGGKTAAAKREVPLSLEALKILARLKTEERVFALDSASLDALFRKIKAKALIDDLHFHDSRAEAVTRLAEKFDILSLAKIVGHKDLRMLQVYYRPKITDMVRMLG